MYIWQIKETVSVHLVQNIQMTSLCKKIMQWFVLAGQVENLVVIYVSKQRRTQNLFQKDILTGKKQKKNLKTIESLIVIEQLSHLRLQFVPVERFITGIDVLCVLNISLTKSSFGVFCCHKTEAYSEPSQISRMKVSAKTVNCLKQLNISSKKLYLRCFTGFWICLCES